MKIKEVKSRFVKHRKPSTLVVRKPSPPPSMFSRDTLTEFVEVVVHKHKEKAAEVVRQQKEMEAEVVRQQKEMEAEVVRHHRKMEERVGHQGFLMEMAFQF